MPDTLLEEIEAVCPGVVHGGMPADLATGRVDGIWGPVADIHLAHATNPDTRHRGATGGVLTALAAHLIASGTVQAVLQSGAAA